MSTEPTRGWSLFDSHLHIIDPRYPLLPNQGYLPEPFTAGDYQRRIASLPVTGGAVVSGSFQGTDQTYLLDALRQLGAGFVGVTQLPADVTDTHLHTLNAAGVRAVRVNLVRGGSETLDRLEVLAHRVFDVVGWHTELYVDSRDLTELHPRLVALPRISIDHLGLSREGFTALLRLVEQGARVKATGFGRVDLDVPTALRQIAAINPAALMFGTDLPSTRAPRPFSFEDVDLLRSALGEEFAHLALHDNAQDFYQPPGKTETAR